MRIPGYLGNQSRSEDHGTRDLREELDLMQAWRSWGQEDLEGGVRRAGGKPTAQVDGVELVGAPRSPTQRVAKTDSNELGEASPCFMPGFSGTSVPIARNSSADGS